MQGTVDSRDYEKEAHLRENKPHCLAACLMLRHNVNVIDTTNNLISNCCFCTCSFIYLSR